MSFFTVTENFQDNNAMALKKAEEEHAKRIAALQEENMTRERALRAEYAKLEVCTEESSFHRIELKKKLEGNQESANEGTCRYAKSRRTKSQRMATGDAE
jgi:hypothetical protein